MSATTDNCANCGAFIRRVVQLGQEFWQDSGGRVVCADGTQAHSSAAADAEAEARYEARKAARAKRREAVGTV